MTLVNNLKKKTSYNGLYKGVEFQIRNWMIGDYSAWGYYLHLPMEQLNDKSFWIKPTQSKYGKYFNMMNHPVLV